MASTDQTEIFAAPAQPRGTMAAFPATLLVVDADDAAAATTRVRLAGAGMPISIETNGDAVLRTVRGSLVRIVVAELYIPCAEGACVVAVLKGDRNRLPRIRVLVHTRHESPADLERALAAGADAVVPKSAPGSVLLREVRRLTGAAIAA